MVVDIELIKRDFPLHYEIFIGNLKGVEEIVKDQNLRKEHLEKLDPRGRTPIILAVIKNKAEIAQLLLNSFNADATFTQGNGWNVVHEGTSTKNIQLLQMILRRRDIQRVEKQEKLIPDLLHELKNALDFYVEMKWEFSTWVPFASRWLPRGQCYRIYKKGSSLRIDSDSDESFENGITFIFKEDGNDVFIFEIDHNSKSILKQIICCNSTSDSSTIENPHGGMDYEEEIKARLSNPSVTTLMDWSSISFEEKKTTGFQRFLAYKGTSFVNGFKCKVFKATDVNLETKFRIEHLSEDQKEKFTMEQVPGFFNKAISYLSKFDIDSTAHVESSSNEKGESEGREVSAQEYFDKDIDLNGRDIGITRKDIRGKSAQFTLSVWLTEEYPLNIKEQLLPIVRLMAISNSQFRSLKDFVELQMPSGFPIKLEIPLFHLVEGSVTFNNIFGMDNQVSGVSNIVNNGRITCVMDEKLFQEPINQGYTFRSSVCFGLGFTTEEEDFFSRIRSSGSAFKEEAGGAESHQMDIYEALNVQRASSLRDYAAITPDEEAEERLFQRAIEESILMYKLNTTESNWKSGGYEEEVDDMQLEQASGEDLEELEKALELSLAESEAAEQQRLQDEETMKKVLEMSLRDY